MTSLKTILRLNAASCIGFGALFVAAPGAVAAFLGAPPAPAIVVLVAGAILIINGLHLLHTSLRSDPPRLLVLYFSAGDFLWVGATAALIATGIWVNAAPGIAAAVAVAAMVGAFGLAQLLALPRTHPQRGSATQ